MAETTLQTPTQNAQGHKRLPYWDNMKGFLIAGVVFVHALYDLPGGGFRYYLIQILCMFIMPVFMFVSGFFSKSKNARSAQSIGKLISAYFIITLLYVFLSLATGIEPQLTTPYFYIWYLLALIVYRLVTPYLAAFKGFLPFSLLLSVLIGFWADVNMKFALARIICFYPFFLAGYYFSKERGQKLAQLSWKYRLPGGLVSLAAAVGLGYVLLFVLKINNSDFLFAAYTGNVLMDACKRIVILLFSVVCVPLALFLTPNVHIPLLTKAGKNSLIIYLVHRPVAQLLALEIKGLAFKWQLLSALGLTLFGVAFWGSDLFAGWVDKLLSGLTDALLLRDSGSRKRQIVWRIVAWIMVLAMLCAPLIRYAAKGSFVRESSSSSQSSDYKGMFSGEEE